MVHTFLLNLPQDAGHLDACNIEKVAYIQTLKKSFDWITHRAWKQMRMRAYAPRVVPDELNYLNGTVS